MKKYFGLFLALCFAASLIGCGAQSGQSNAPSTTSAVTISGTVAASQADLQQLGVSALSVKASNASDLAAQGVPASSIKAAGLVPLTTSGTVITIGLLKADGSFEKVAEGTVNPDGTYSVRIENYDASKTYGAIVIKTSTETNKTLEMKIIYPAPTNNEIKGSDAAITPQTTLIAQMIIEKVVKVLESNKIDPNIIATIKDTIIAAVDSLISSGAISVTAVRDANASDNSQLNDAMDKASSDTTISSKLDSVRGALGLAKATDFDSARGAMFVLFKTTMGDPRGIPEEIVNAFAAAFLNGVTKTTTDLTNAINSSLFDKNTNQAVAGSFTVSQVASEIQNMLRHVYSASAQAPNEEMPAGVRTVIEATFPKATWASKTIGANTSFSVPQMIILVNAADLLLAASPNTGFNPSQMAYSLGLMAGVENKAKIMHSELKVVCFEDWQNATPGQKASIYQALATWVDVGNVVNPNPQETAGYTCWLTYPTASGDKTVQYKSRTDKETHENGPPPGWKVYSIEPWDQESSKITDFKAGTATITVKNASGAAVDTKTIEILNIDLSNANLEINIPKPAWIDHPEDISQFSKGSKPTFVWTLKSLGASIPSGYRLGYVINIRQGEFVTQTDGRVDFFVNWGDPNNTIFDSWDKQEFPEALVGETTNWVVPTALSNESFYNFGITVVVINKKTNTPVVEGPYRGGIFMVGSPTIPAKFKEQYNFEPPEKVDVLTQTYNLEGKVHSDLLQRFSGSDVKVGLFREQYDPSKGFNLTLVAGVTPVGLSDVANQSYKTFKLVVPGSAFGSNYGMYAVIMFKDTNGNGAWDVSEEFERSQKGIDHQSFGTKVHWPGGGDELHKSQIDFNFIYYGKSF